MLLKLATQCAAHLAPFDVSAFNLQSSALRLCPLLQAFRCHNKEGCVCTGVLRVRCSLWLCCRCCLGRQSLLCFVRHCVHPCPKHPQQSSSLCGSQPCCTQQSGGCLHPQGAQTALAIQAWYVVVVVAVLDTTGSHIVLPDVCYNSMYDEPGCMLSHTCMCCVAAACTPAIMQLLHRRDSHRVTDTECSNNRGSVGTISLIYVPCICNAGVGHGVAAELTARCPG